MDAKTVLMCASAGIILLLGCAHLLFTFRGNKLTPRDDALTESMKQVSPVISKETTIWRAWIGFNASHSMGAILFGLIYGYLAIAHKEVLFGSPFLLGLGFAMLAAYTALGRRYWFSTPFRGIVVALACYVASIAQDFF